jgi:hypothetical protein
MTSNNFTTNTEQLFAEGSQLPIEDEEVAEQDLSQDLFSDDGRF